MVLLFRMQGMVANYLRPSVGIYVAQSCEGLERLSFLYDLVEQLIIPQSLNLV